MQVIIIGAGVTGVATAYYLQQHGVDVTVLERAEGAGLETSFGNGGGLTASVVEPWNEPGIQKVLLRSLGRNDAPILLRLAIYPSMHSSIYPFIHLFINLSIYLSIHSSIYPSIYSSIYPCIHQSIHLSIHPFINLSIYPFVPLYFSVINRWSSVISY